MKYLILIPALVFTQVATAGISDLTMMHTKPVCNYPGKAASWCTKDDMVKVGEDSGLVARINEQIEMAQDPELSRIFVAYLSFSNKPIARKLCERAKAGVKIEFFLDSDAPSANKDLIDQMNSCKTQDGRSTVTFHFLGVKPNPWRLHHNKFLIVDTGTSPEVKINFSSGNLSAFGTSLHFDHWVTVTTSKDTSFYKTHMCVVKALKVAIDPDQDGIDESIDDPVVYRKTLDDCLQTRVTLKKCTKQQMANNKTNQCYKVVPPMSTEQAIAAEKIAPLFSPNPKNEIARTLIGEINKMKKGERISGAIQHFLHYGIAQALVGAAQRGVQVQMLMDNDVLSGESEVTGVTDFFHSVLDNQGIEFRFMETNAENRQMMHNKFLILGDRRVFAGAGHFTTAAMKDSYENFYLMQDEKIQRQYQALFKFMYDMSISKKQVLESIGESDDESINN